MRHVLVAPLALTTFIAIPNARADGETSPLLGGSVIGTASTRSADSAAGIEVEAAVWSHWLGFAAEFSSNVWSGDAPPTTTLVLGGSVRVLLLRSLVGSPLEPSDVEMGVELQGIIEKTMWSSSDDSQDSYHRGLGLAVRLRGSTDDDVPHLIAESRFFIRVMSWQKHDPPIAARMTQPPSSDDQDFMILVGIGAAFGGGQPRYLQQFRRRVFE
jgi:hypothetical protein